MRLAAWAVAASVLAGVATLTAQAPVEPSPGTREMAALLAARAAAVGPGDLWFNVNDRRAEAIAAAIAGAPAAPNLVDLRDRRWPRSCSSPDATPTASPSSTIC